MIFARLSRLTPHLARQFSSSENIHIAKTLVNHLDKLEERDFPNHYFHLKKLQQEISDLHNEHEELASIDPQDELATIAQDECKEIDAKIRLLLKNSWQFLDSLNKYDSQDAFLEVTAGAGGLEAGMFAAEILNLYIGYINHLGYQYEKIEEEFLPSDKGSVSPIAKTKLSISGHNVFSSLKYECGVHRVQRVPVTGTKSDRLQTSTCSVAVIPQPKDEDIILNPKDIKEETMTSSGKGGQNVNKVATAIRLIHIPTGMNIKCQEERYLQQNKKKAYKYLKDILYNHQYEKDMAEISKSRKSQVGNMDRNEKIRSYNFNRNAISDHRLGEVKQVQGISDFLQGNHGYEVLEFFRKNLEDKNSIDSLKSYLGIN